MFKYIGKYIKQNKYEYIWGIIALILVDIALIAIPRILGDIIDSILDGKMDINNLIVYVSTILLLSIFMFIGRYFWRTLFFGATWKVEVSIRNAFFEQLEKLSYNFYIKYKTGDLMSRMTNDIENIHGLSQGALMTIDALFIFITTFIFMLIDVDYRLTIIALFPLLLLSVLMIAFAPHLSKRYEKVNENYADMSENIREVFTGIRVIKAFSKEEDIIENFNVENQNLFKSRFRYVRLNSFIEPIITLLSFSTLALSIFFGSRYVFAGTISIGDFVEFITYLNIIIWPFMAFGMVVNLLQRGRASIKRVNEIFDQMPDITDNHADLDITDFEPEIEFADLSFAYIDSLVPILKHIDLKLEKGKKLGIIGRAGSGKSTLMNLLLKLQNSPQGSLFVGGEDISKIPMNVLRRNIGYISQDSFMFSNTVRFNITLGEDYDDEKVQHYAKIAGIHDEIMAMPDGYESILTESGSNISGGQKQRIAIARALIREPKIVVFDDSLSAVDTITEMKILENLKVALKDITTVISTHRVVSIADADIIAIIENGFISAVGTHDELLMNNEYYRELFKYQRMDIIEQSQPNPQQGDYQPLQTDAQYLKTHDNVGVR